MLTIGEIAKAAGCTVIDRNLRWDNAVLSAYADVLQEADDDTTIYGIELREDISPPAHYRSIDHHGDRQQQPSALEQVATLLGISLSRRQQLIAANDRGYIPAMQALGATTEEIDAIRHADRVAQWVTPQDEQLAEEAIANTAIRHNDLILVHSATSHFSTITDRLYPYHRLLIYTDREIVYYGTDRDKIISLFLQHTVDSNIYYGGGDTGYAGIARNRLSADEIASIVSEIENI